jgi:hypothetical protein
MVHSLDGTYEGGSPPSKCPLAIVSVLEEQPEISIHDLHKQVRKTAKKRFCLRTVQRYIQVMKREGTIECVVKKGNQKFPVYRLKVK